MNVNIYFRVPNFLKELIALTDLRLFIAETTNRLNKQTFALAGAGDFPYFYDSNRDLGFYEYVVRSAVRGIIKMQLRGMDPFFGCEPENVFNRLWMYKAVGDGGLMYEETKREFEKVLGLIRKFEGKGNVIMFLADCLDAKDSQLYREFRMVHPIQDNNVVDKYITVPVCNVIISSGGGTMYFRIFNGKEHVDIDIPYEYQFDFALRLAYLEVAVKKLMAKKKLPANAWFRL